MIDLTSPTYVLRSNNFYNNCSSSDEMRKFDGLVLAATECQIYDFIESSIGSSKTPILRLDISPCPSVIGLKTERLKLYRLNVKLFLLS